MPESSVSDMDEQRRATFAAMVAGGDAIMLLVDPETMRYVEVSPAAERFYGWSRQEFLTKGPTDVNPLDPRELKRRITAASRGADEGVDEAQHLLATGELRDVEVHTRGIDLEGRTCVIATVFDLRERRRVLNELEASEERYRTLVELTPDALFVQTGGRFAYLNPAAVRLFGADDADELVGRDVFELVHPDFRDAVAARLHTLRDERRPVPAMRQKYLRLNGEAVDVEVAAVPIDFGGEPGAQVLARDITEAIVAEAVMAWNTAIVESSKDAVYSADLEGRILNWNPAAQAIFGYTAEEMVGRSVLDMIPEELREETNRRRDRVMASARAEHFETVRIRKDGTGVDVSISLSPIDDGSGRLIGISAIARDISERKQLEQAKDEFLSLVSHELRTPLTTIHGYAQLLADPKRPFRLARRVQVGERLLQRAEDMMSLVEDLLQAGRLRSGILRMQPEPVDAMGMLAALAETLADEDSERLRLVGEDRPITVSCDPKWISVALGNLVGNALRFSPPEEPVVVGVVRDGATVSFKVSDRGPGLEPAAAERLFDRFVQGDMSSTRPHEGAGLGLYIARRIVELHDGTITVETAPGGGAVFSITLPCA
ncbi:MAG: PAS domain S-box protein [Coriobacteriia bacterium]|nr:PAS domain S-box protein [Coriobacteriia bacterium]